MQFLLSKARRIVIKLGTGILTKDVGQLDYERIQAICSQAAELRGKGLEVVLVSSGAVGMGMGRLGLKKRPADMPTLQACASIGQTILMNTWQRAFESHGVTVAQLLLTHEDLRARKRHVSVMNTIERLLSLGVAPIINENDTVSVAELELGFGDNDMLSALVAIQTKADILAILSTIPGLIDMKGSGEVVPLVQEIGPDIEAMAGGTSSPTAVGGMLSKIEAARRATRSGCGVFIGSGQDERTLLKLFGGESGGTFFMPRRISMQSRKRWIAFFEKPGGVVRVDAGAARALASEGRSLLARGVLGCDGSFSSGEVVNIATDQGDVFARGIVRFSSDAIQAAAGKSNDEVKRLFPDSSRQEIIHRDTLALLSSG